MAYYNGKALTTGCSDSSSCYVKTEIMDMSTLEWSNGQVHILSCIVSYYSRLADNFSAEKFRKVYYYSTAATADTAYIIGGIYQGSGYSTTIAQFKNHQWSKVGDLSQGRQYHGSISVGTETMVIGGYVSSSS